MHQPLGLYVGRTQGLLAKRMEAMTGGEPDEAADAIMAALAERSWLLAH